MVGGFCARMMAFCVPATVVDVMVDELDAMLIILPGFTFIFVLGISLPPIDIGPWFNTSKFPGVDSTTVSVWAPPYTELYK